LLLLFTEKVNNITHLFLYYYVLFHIALAKFRVEIGDAIILNPYSFGHAFAYRESLQRHNMELKKRLEWVFKRNIKNKVPLLSRT